MKKIFFSLFAVAATLSLFSCSEKFKVAAPYKDITVIYGFLDIRDTAHYIRIQKAFLDENKSAISMAQTSDSNFFSNINVRIERYRAASNNGVYTYVDSIHLNRVDLTQEGYPKQPGAFFNSPNYAYKFTDALQPQYIHRIKVTHFNTGITDSADAPVIDTVKTAFEVPVIDNSLINLQGMQFFSVLPKRYFEFTGTYLPVIGYDYNGETNPVRIAQAIIRFNWDDSDINTKLRTPHYFDFDAGYTIVSHDNNTFEYKLDNKSIYNAISSGMGTAPANTVRLINRCDITVYLSTTEYANYRNSILVQGNGLTGSEISPMYTNIKGANAFGLYTSRAMHTGPITITPRTVDSLIVSPLLTHVNIKGTAYH